MTFNGLHAVVVGRSPSTHPRERPATSGPPPLLRSHFPRARGDTRGPPYAAPMPAPRAPRSGRLWSTRDRPGDNSTGAQWGRSRDARVGRFSGFHISGFPRTSRCAGLSAGVWGSGNLAACRVHPAHANAGRSWGTDDPELTLNRSDRVCRFRTSCSSILRLSPCRIVDITARFPCIAHSARCAHT